MKLFRFFTAVVLASPSVTTAGAKVDFLKEVKPILEMNCIACHNQAHAEENGKYRMDAKAEAFKPKKNKQRILPGHPEQSKVYTLTILPANDDNLMPPKDKRPPLTRDETEILRRWIAEGADWPEGVTLQTVMKVDFVRDVQPILEQGGPLSQKSIEILRLWLDQGAPWPKDVKLGGGSPLKNKEMAIVADIHKKILANSKEQTQAEMKFYTNTIPGTTVSYAMVPIPGGEFLMGSPKSESKRKPDEGPQHKVKLDPFWMEQHEVTWNEYELFMFPDESKPPQERNEFRVPPGQTERGIHSASPAAGDGATNYISDVADAVARPSKPYVEMSFGMGKDGFPAISMTQHAASKYCEWLSATTGHFYRLPTEAEWEYACRAGTTTSYSFGNDPSKLGEYAWFADNSDFKYQKVGKKKPNPWGLYDMHGNVCEWTLDQYDANYYQQFKDVVSNPWNKATQPYPHCARGGAWDDDAEKLRSAARRGSDPSWKMQDPQLPKSIWYHTDAQFLGFRIVRPLKVPPPEELYNYWNSGVEKD